MIRYLATAASVFAISAASLPGAANAQQSWYEGEFQKCANLTTVDMVDCAARLPKVWDARLNAAYKQVMAPDFFTTARQKKLRAAQRAWIKYRDANCAQYVAGEGSIARVNVAECFRVMTANRASELEQMLRP